MPCLQLHFWCLGIDVFALYSVDAEFPVDQVPPVEPAVRSRPNPALVVLFCMALAAACRVWLGFCICVRRGHGSFSSCGVFDFDTWMIFALQVGKCFSVLDKMLLLGMFYVHQKSLFPRKLNCVSLHGWTLVLFS